MERHAPATAIPVEVLDRADMREALAAHDFGVVFALARKWAGISYVKMADACGIKRERVGAMARGADLRVTSYDKIAQIADALRIPGHLLGLAPRYWETSPGMTVVSSALHREGDESVLRRDFLKLSAGMGVLTVMPAVDSARQGRRVGRELPALIRARTARLRRLDDVLGGGDTFRVYLAEYQSTADVLKHGRYADGVGRDLLAVLAEQAQQAGWAAFDAGNHADAVRLYKASQSAATEAGDPGLAGNALAFLAYERIGREPQAALDLAVASCEAAVGALTGPVGALLHERRAWAHAINGNATEAARALDLAAEALACSPPGPPPDWAVWVDASELQIMAGRCWTELRRPLRAVPILTDVLGRFADAHARDKALYSSWLADAYLAAGEIEESAAVAGRVLDLSAGVASVRPRQQISGVLQQLEKEHRAVPAVIQTLEKARG